MAKKSRKTVLADSRDNSSVSPVSEAEKIVQEKRRELNRNPVGDSAIAESNKVDLQLQQQKEAMQKAIDLLYKPENFRGIFRAPADAMLALTGDKVWNVSKEETDTMASTGMVTMQFFMQSDPKWLALTLFSMSIFSVYGSRTAAYLMNRREAKAKAEAEKQPVGPHAKVDNR